MFIDWLVLIIIILFSILKNLAREKLIKINTGLIRKSQLNPLAPEKENVTEVKSK